MNLDLSGTQAVWLPTDILWPPNLETIPEDAVRLIEDPNWCAQVKEDGVHLLTARTDTKLITLNRKGEPHAIPPATAAALMDLPAKTLLDGEKLHEGGLVLFDAIYLNDQDLRELPYSARLAVLDQQVLPRVNRAVVRVVAYETGAAQKLAMVTRLRAERAEGVIFKDLRAKYVPGRPGDKGAPWTMRRLKFRKSLTCICQRRKAEDPKASFEMFVLDETGKPVNIGQVSAQQFFNQVEPMTARIAEVTYLYATPSNKLVQPVLVRPTPWRTDKAAEECTLDQLVRGGRFAVKKG